MTGRTRSLMRASATLGVFAVLVAGCAGPAASATPAPSATPATSTTLGALASRSRSPSPTAVPAADAAGVACEANTTLWTKTDAAGSEVPIAITLTCANAVAAAKALVGPNEAVADIEFYFGLWCPPGAICPASPPKRGHVMFHTCGGQADILVDVVADDAGKVTASHQRTAPSPSGG